MNIKGKFSIDRVLFESLAVKNNYLNLTRLYCPEEKIEKTSIGKKSKKL